MSRLDALTNSIQLYSDALNQYNFVQKLKENLIQSGSSETHQKKVQMKVKITLIVVQYNKNIHHTNDNYVKLFFTKDNQLP